MGVGDWTPESEEHPNLRDHFAINEHSQPVLQTNQDLADFLGIPVNTVSKWRHTPVALAKWRYMCADAMMESRKT